MSGSLEQLGGEFQIAQAGGLEIPSYGTFGPITIPPPGGSNYPITNVPPSLQSPPDSYGDVPYQTITPGNSGDPSGYPTGPPAIGTPGATIYDPNQFLPGYQQPGGQPGAGPQYPSNVGSGLPAQVGGDIGAIPGQIGAGIMSMLPKLTQIEELAIRALLVLIGLVLVAAGFYLAGQRGVKAVTIRQLGQAAL